MDSQSENDCEEQISGSNFVSEETFEDGKVSKDRESSTESTVAVSNPTENELINIDEIELSDEDTWLYTSPTKMTNEEQGLSPYKWLRKDVEDPDNRELQIAKTALVCKLDELEVLKAAQKIPKLTPKLCDTKESKEFCEVPHLDEHSVSIPQEEAVTLTDVSVSKGCSENDVTQLHSDLASTEVVCVEKNLPVPDLQPYNVVDIFERARLQEESLKESSSRFFSQAAKTFPRRMHVAASVSVPKLQKPASIEALHICTDKPSDTVSSSVNTAQHVTNVSSPNQSPFGSAVSLNCVHDNHRSSLPNLNKGYYSLRTKKPKRTNEPRIQCPLPIYPKSQMNGATQEAPPLRNVAVQPRNCYRESQTLPSSYRIKSKNVSNSKRENGASTMPRRDSAPSSQYQKSLLQGNSSRRESMPCIAQNKDSVNGKPPVFHVSPKKNSVPFSQHFEGSLQNSKAVSMNCLRPDSRISPVKEYPRRASHSAVKRQILGSVHNYSTEEEFPGIQRNVDLRKPSVPSKIPSPNSRSGIPVPSTQFIPRSNHAENSWS